MTRASDLTGFWSGEYWYDIAGEPRVPFLANLDDQAGALTGSISEPNTITDASDRLTAFVRGQRIGSEVEFAKVYDGASDAAHRVDYLGIVADDGAAISGRWMLDGLIGGFSMTREIAVGDEVEEQQQVVMHHEG
ncbi:hypothetical protein [Sphingomonas sp.]|uniref:hypothetical protein n=1 Tax=Sphingomonas sp. TaxID=28214 RepID=UPI002DD65505|nr:hypothetical protein [Sphingomonas sp.]